MSAAILSTEMSGTDRLKQERLLYSEASFSDTQSESDDDLWTQEKERPPSNLTVKVLSSEVNTGHSSLQRQSSKYDRAPSASVPKTFSDQPATNTPMAAAILDMLHEGWLVSVRLCCA